MEYIILAHSSVSVLSTNVNAHIQTGWVPQGGVTTVHRASIRETAYYQAMTRSEDVENIKNSRYGWSRDDNTSR